MAEVQESQNSSLAASNSEDSDPVDIVQVQQDFYDSFKDSSDEYTHGYCEVLNPEVLEHMIETTMILYTEMNGKQLSAFSECLWQQKKFTGSDNLKMSQLFVCCVYDSDGKITYPLRIKSKKFSIRPIYRIPKCFKDQNQRNCCAIFVDEFARVYSNWDDFKRNNKYGNCLIVAPKGGFYDASPSNHVRLDILSQEAGVTKVFDIGSTVGSVGSTGVVLAGLIPSVTLAPAVVVGATVVGVSCAVYAAGRSVYQLFDRKKHEQSIGFGNRESRAAWFNIGSGVLCAGAAAGAKVATQAALNRRTISVVGQKAIRYVGIGSLGFQVIGCADDLYGIISDLRSKKPISTVYLAQFGAQLFLLTLSVKNFRLTEKLTEVSGSRNPKSIRKILTQHNSDGSFKYLLTGAEFIEQNVGDFANPLLLKSIVGGCLNVVPKVKQECEQVFDRRFKFILNEMVNNSIVIDGETKSTEEKESMNQLLNFLLVKMNLVSLEKLLKCTKKYATESFRLYSETRGIFPFENYLKSVYMSICKMAAEGKVEDINDFISVLNDDSFDKIVDEIKFCSNSVNFTCYLADQRDEFDQIFADDLASGPGLARKIYLIIHERSEKFIKEFAEFPVTTSLDKLSEAVQQVLRRLSIEAATLFFGLIKSLLNECVLQLTTDQYIKEILQMFVKKCNGNLKEIEEYLKKCLDGKDDSYYKTKMQTLVYFYSKDFAQSKNCKVCDGQTFAQT